MVERAALGFRSHSGWAAAVALDGDVSAPLLADRRRLVLTDGELPVQPYHAVQRLNLDEAESRVRHAEKVIRDSALRGVREIITHLGAGGAEVLAAGIVMSGGRLVLSTAEALTSHAMMHNAEGWLYREALMWACRECGLTVAGALEQDAHFEAAAAAGMPPRVLAGRVSGFRRDVGPPWRQDQKSAAAVAWLALALDATAVR